MSLNYKFSEDKALPELKEYIDSTYHQHYNKNNFQATEFIIDCGHGEGFCIGNIMKYAQRYGKKNGYDERDLYKIIHYAIILIGQKIKEYELKEYEEQMQIDSD